MRKAAFLRRDTVVFLALVAVAAVWAAPTSSVERNAHAAETDLANLRELFQEAREFHSNEKYGDSNRVFEQLLGHIPERGQYDRDRNFIFYYMATNSANLGQKKEAVSFLRRSVEAGFWNYKMIAQDRNLETLRKDEEFHEVLQLAKDGLINLVFSKKDIHGNQLKREDYEGKVVVLDMWATWCGPCRKAIPHLVSLQKKYKDKDLRIIGLACERPPVDDAKKAYVTQFTERYGINYPIVMLSEQEQAIAEIRSLPTMVFLDRKLQEREREPGYRPEHYIESKILPLLREKAPTVKN